MLDAALDRLFSGSRAAFVAERQRLAKELKAAGKKEEAAQVAALTKPTLAAWVVNQLARRHPELVKKLGKAGARLREVQLGRHEQTGDDRRAFSEAVAAQRDALREARAAALEILKEEGNAAPVHLVETVLRILRGGAASDEAQATIAQGRLLQEPAGGDEMGLLAGQAVFGTVAGKAAASPERASLQARGSDGKSGPDAKETASRAEERARKAAALAAERENARRRAAEEREVAKLRAAAEKADAQRAEREEDVEAARQTLAKAEARAAAAATAAESARVRLTEAERRLRAGVS